MTALTEWWTDMGVSVDTALVDALLKAAPEAELAQRAIEPTANVSTSAPMRKGARTVSDWANEARAKARAAQSMDTLAEAIRTFEGSPLKATCEQAVVSDGIAGASLMVIGEGPGAEEDRRGLPFVGKAGQQGRARLRGAEPAHAVLSSGGGARRHDARAKGAVR